MKIKRPKAMPLYEFEEVPKRTWAPLELVGNARPSWMCNIPSDVVHSVYASGSGVGIPKPGNYSLPAGDLVGGIDIYRNAADDSVKYNKDWYAIVVDLGHDNMLLACGPYKDNEHWINKIPERLKEAEILLVPPKKGE